MENNEEKKRETAKHTNNTSVKSSKICYFILIMIILFVIAAGIFFFMPYTSLKDNNVNNSNSKIFNLEDSKQFENASNLTSKDLNIDVENGVSKVKGSVYNSSEEIMRNIKCIYSLVDNNNSVVYELTIPILKIDANNYSAFSSISAIDLSSVVDYYVKLAE